MRDYFYSCHAVVVHASTDNAWFADNQRFFMIFAAPALLFVAGVSMDVSKKRPAESHILFLLIFGMGCPFELHPETPKEGLSYAELPFDPEYLVMAIENVKRLAAEDNIKFNLPSRMPNSRLAMSVAEFAKKKGKFDVLHALLFEKYWIEDKDIGNLDVLLDFATSIGLDRDELLAYLKSNEANKILHKHFAEARKYGITGVPTFIIGRTIISGAQSYTVFAKAVEAAQKVSH